MSLIICIIEYTFTDIIRVIIKFSHLVKRTIVIGAIPFTVLYFRIIYLFIIVGFNYT